MHELFNPAGLCVVDDQEGAISYGWIARRVLYARFVGSLSAELGAAFVRQLETLVRGVSTFAYFGDVSALSEYDLMARLAFERFVEAERAKLAALVILTWAGGISPAARAFAARFGDTVRFVGDPMEFERALSNVAPLPSTSAPERAPVWQVLAPR